MQKEEVLLSVQNISKSYNNKNILNDISFELKEKEILSLVGYSGQGKTTILNIICGIEIPDSGEIHYRGVLKNPKHIIGYSSQSHSFIEELSVIENLNYFGSLYNLDKEEIQKRTNQLIKKFNLNSVKDNISYNLSEGQKKRVDIACSLINNPKILILDEPTANLDFKLRDDFLTYIKKIREEGVSVIFVSHILEDIEEVSDKIIILNNTKIKELRTTQNLKKHFLEFAKKGGR